MASARPGTTRLVWYEREQDQGVVPDRWLQAARAQLPEAVPIRFGDSEPLRQRLDRDGEDGLRQTWSQSSDLVFLSAAPAMPHAALAAPRRPANQRLGDMTAHTLELRAPTDDPRLRAFALAFATPATVLVTVNEQPAQGQGSNSGGHRYLAGLGQWLGLPEQPPRWCWFGAAYTHALRKARLDLQPMAGGALWTGGAWVPPSMRLVEAGLEPHDQCADEIPRAVGPSRPIWAGTRRLRDW